ncbi:hypothetical protein NLU13_5010 [Sarocladium strictum]|uniref:Uncharacterized protein n=1 Tax=Sarocladium strictum TaxID=5046 RepID=A0AA39GML8_SARSR|nr:hypothetical protein NLU13_5010 [Sarocladium strictum]
MSQPILSIHDDRDNKAKSIANILPARIDHDGPVDPIESFWTPTQGEDDSRTAYFRGRKLQGKTVKLPEQCRGVVLQRRDDPSDAKKPTETEENVIDLEAEEPGPDTGTMKVTAEFDEMVVWGHEAVADATGDPYVRSIEEWLQVSEKIHSYTANNAGSDNK